MVTAGACWAWGSAACRDPSSPGMFAFQPRRCCPVPTMFSEQAAPTAQGLLSPPSAEASTFARVPVSAYADHSQPFRLAERSFSRQYAHIYAARLIEMRPILEERARRKWGESVWGVIPPPPIFGRGGQSCAAGTVPVGSSSVTFRRTLAIGP